jgi:ketosteroid isomerase-like protein
MPANTPPQVGVAAIAAAGTSDTSPFNIRWQLLEIEGFHDLAYVRGRWWVTIPQSNGPQPADSGNYLEVWRRQPGGAWRVARDMYSSEVPPKALPTASTP